jgi:hypothetical protein
VRHEVAAIPLGDDKRAMSMTGAERAAAEERLTQLIWRLRGMYGGDPELIKARYHSGTEVGPRLQEPALDQAVMPVVRDMLREEGWVPCSDGIWRRP